MKTLSFFGGWIFSRLMLPCGRKCWLDNTYLLWFPCCNKALQLCLHSCSFPFMTILCFMLVIIFDLVFSALFLFATTLNLIWFTFPFIFVVRLLLSSWCSCSFICVPCFVVLLLDALLVAPHAEFSSRPSARTIVCCSN